MHTNTGVFRILQVKRWHTGLMQETSPSIFTMFFTTPSPPYRLVERKEGKFKMPQEDTRDPALGTVRQESLEE